jgi:kynurenine formamidase
MCVPGTVETVRARIEEEGPPEISVPRVSRRAALLAGAGALAASAAPTNAFAQRGAPAGKRLADLTHTYTDTFPVFPGAPETDRRTHVTIEQNGFYGQVWTLWEHTCTHIDAPGHFIKGGRHTPALKLRELIAPVVVIDISDRAAKDPDTTVTPDDLRRFERSRGRIPKRSLVCMYSGWESRAGSTEDYRNADANGVMHFPGFGKEAIEWLLKRRDIRGIGVDTLSLDPGNSTTFDAHITILSADRYGIENLKNLKGIPARGATIYVGVIPWLEGSGGPARVFAAW